MEALLSYNSDAPKLTNTNLFCSVNMLLIPPSGSGKDGEVSEIISNSEKNL